MENYELLKDIRSGNFGMARHLFGDGAAAVIIGTNPDPAVEHPTLKLVSIAQTILPDSDGAIDGHLREVGLTSHLLKGVPGIKKKNRKELDGGVHADRNQ